MDIEEARAFAGENHRAVLATFRRDGRPQISPCLAGVDPEGRVEISSNAWKAKVRNLLRDPRASVLVMTDKFFEKRWILLDGTAEIVPLPGALEPLLGYERRMTGEEPDREEYERAAEEQQAVLIRITIERAAGTAGSA